MTLRWQPHTVQPKGPTTAVIAANMVDDSHPPLYCLVGAIYRWNALLACWVEEVSGQPLDTDMPYYWLDEGELLATLAHAAAPARH